MAPAPPAPAGSPAPPTEPAGPAPSPPPPLAVAEAPARQQLVVERTLPLGKWPEGVVVVDGAAWVAESGARRVARVALDGNAKAVHVSVGRLPVEMGHAANGKVYALAHTDKTLWEIDPASNRGRVLATVADCPESMALDGGVAWVLLWSKCSSAGSSVARVDLATGKQASSPATGDDAWGIAPGAGRAWVARGNGTLSSVDVATLQDVRTDDTRSTPRASSVVGAGRDTIYASHGAVVVRTDAATGKATHSATLADRVAVVAPDVQVVWVVGAAGTIWALDPASLRVQRELKPESPYEPHGFARWGERFVVTVHGPGDEGRLLVLAAPPSGDGAR